MSQNQNTVHHGTCGEEQPTEPQSLETQSMKTAHHGICGEDSRTEPVKSRPKVLFVKSERYELLSRALPRNSKRAIIVQRLIDAIGVLDRCTVVEARKLPPRKLQGFHTREYVKAVEDGKKLNGKKRTQFGLVDDCTVFDGLFELIQLEAGGSVLAAQALNNGLCETAIWWGGGRHHAGRDMASGYCYVNDIVLAMFELLRTFPRLMYVDVDVHHGDAVEEAFCLSESVLTISFHKHGPLFFPGSGALSEQSGAAGRRSVINVPLQDGCSDANFIPLCTHTITEAAAAFEPAAVVLQCGADGLAGDPVGCFSLGSRSFLAALAACTALSKPLLLLGGGGYHEANTARVWAALTCAAAGMGVPVEVPEHCLYEAYAPDFLLEARGGQRRDCNSEAYLQEVRGAVDAAIAEIARGGGEEADESTESADSRGLDWGGGVGEDEGEEARRGEPKGCAGSEPEEAEGVLEEGGSEAHAGGWDQAAPASDGGPGGGRGGQGEERETKRARSTSSESGATGRACCGAGAAPGVFGAEGGPGCCQ